MSLMTRRKFNAQSRRKNGINCLQFSLAEDLIILFQTLSLSLGPGSRSGKGGNIDHVKNLHSSFSGIMLQADRLGHNCMRRGTVV